MSSVAMLSSSSMSRAVARPSSRRSTVRASAALAPQKGDQNRHSSSPKLQSTAVMAPLSLPGPTGSGLTSWMQHLELFFTVKPAPKAPSRLSWMSELSDVNFDEDEEDDSADHIRYTSHLADRLAMAPVAGGDSSDSH